MPDTSAADDAARILAAPQNFHLRWNTPLSEAHADLLIEACAPSPGARVLDLGCGWGELLMRLVAPAADATGDGVDTDPDALARGERLAAERGLGTRVRFHRTPAPEWQAEAYDIAVCIGATHAWPDSTTGALRALRTALRPGGTALLGEGFWARQPTPEALAGLGAEPEELGTLHQLVTAATAAGFRPLQVTVADEREWDLFESYARAGRGERWALAHPGHPLRDRVLAEAERHRDGYLSGYRGVLGFAYLVLAAA
jgi:SAM-dependent methyltransferase